MGLTQERPATAAAQPALREASRDLPCIEGVHDLGDFRLQSGEVLPSLRIAYRAYGRLNADRSNVVVHPTSFGASDDDEEWLVHEGVLDATRNFVVIVNLIGNGKSTAPSHRPAVRGFPLVSLYDNVQAQMLTLEAVFGIRDVSMVYGWSMGGMQAYHWAVAFPDRVRRIAVVCGSARCSVHNHVFLEGVKAALQLDPDFAEGWASGPARRGLKAMARVYAGWALSQQWYREARWTDVGYASLDDFLKRSWEDQFVVGHPNDLSAQIRTWQHADIGRHEGFGGDWRRALQSIDASVLLMPGATDLYFPVADNAIELPYLKRGRLEPIDSIWGHRAGNPRHRGADLAFLRQAVARHLASE
ncbi:MAG: alpha/beta fold hydrolase [Burkholderiales bacterium]|nr:alpha/beta fold hydrolase [Burkholderiales bacterium]